MTPAMKDLINSFVVSASNIGSPGNTLVTIHSSRGIKISDADTMPIYSFGKR